MTNGFHKRTGKSDPRPTGRKNQPAGKVLVEEKLTGTPRDVAPDTEAGGPRSERASG